MNLAPIDTYAGKLIASMKNNLEIDLPGSRDESGGATTPWLPPRGACIVGTMNSYLEDASRKMLFTADHSKDLNRSRCRIGLNRW